MEWYGLRRQRTDGADGAVDVLDVDEVTGGGVDLAAAADVELVMAVESGGRGESGKGVGGLAPGRGLAG